MDKLVSIVLPTYNGQQYLGESIESVVRQSYQNWELIIVDDCSTDFTHRIAESYSKKDARIRVIHNQRNMKLPSSLNIGFREAQGDYLTWTSDDNKFLPGALSDMVRVLNHNEAEMVSADFQLMDETGKELPQKYSYNEYVMPFRDTVGACFMYTRKVLKEIGEYDPDLFCVEDYDYWLRVLDRFHHIEHIPKILYLYRLHKGALTNTHRFEVLKKRVVLVDRSLEKILTEYRNDKNALTEVYYLYVSGGRGLECIQKKFFPLVPELQMEQIDFDTEGNYIIFGSGNYGRLASKELKDRALCFADNDPSKWNTLLDGLMILPIEEAVKRFPDSRIMIAVGNANTYDIIRQIVDLGYSRYWTVFDIFRTHTVNA